MHAKLTAYWLTTGFLVVNMLSGALAELAQLDGNVQGMRQLGYPVYFMLILGVWKLLATLAILAPRFPRLKEWAYAGLFFTMSGAALSHVISGDAAWHALYTGGLAVVVLASWWLRPSSRTLGVLLPTLA